MFKVIVGNIGQVYHGESYDEALKTFEEYQGQSEIGYGRAAGEPVTMLDDDVIVKEHDGEYYDEPWDGFNSDVEADADALASMGWGTDEDYE